MVNDKRRNRVRDFISCGGSEYARKNTRTSRVAAEELRLNCWPPSVWACYSCESLAYFFLELEPCRLVRRGSGPSCLHLRVRGDDSDIGKCRWCSGRENPCAGGRWEIADPRRCGRAR